MVVPSQLVGFEVCRLGLRHCLYHLDHPVLVLFGLQLGYLDFEYRCRLLGNLGFESLSHHLESLRYETNCKKHVDLGCDTHY